MRTRSNKPSRGIQNRKAGTVTALPLAASKQNRKSINNLTESDLHADEIAKLQRKIAQLPDIDAAKIVDLHDRILRGDYEVDSEVLAENLQKFESDL